MPRSHLVRRPNPVWPCKREQPPLQKGKPRPHHDRQKPVQDDLEGEPVCRVPERLVLPFLEIPVVVVDAPHSEVGGLLASWGVAGAMPLQVLAFQLARGDVLPFSGHSVCSVLYVE